jgi:hypothetical protein
VLHPPAADKAAVEKILKEHRIDGPIAAMQDYGDYWLVCLAGVPPRDDQRDVSLKMPVGFKVFRDGRIERPADVNPTKRL